MSGFTFLVLLLSFQLPLIYCRPDYYWRNITVEDWTIYPDALIGVTNNPSNIYIGRAPYMDHGLFVGEIDPTQKGINVTGFSMGQVHLVDQFVEILCTPEGGSFTWVPATARTLQDVPGKIIGGYEINKITLQPSVLYIGRGSIDQNSGRKFIGKLVGFNTGSTEYNNILYVAYNGREKRVSEYEVLTYVN